MDYNRLAEALSVIFSKREGMDIRMRVVERGTQNDVKGISGNIPK